MDTKMCIKIYLWIGMNKQILWKDCENFLKKIEELKPYIVKLYKNGIIRPKTYPLDYAIGERNLKPVIVIIYDKCIFSIKDWVCRVWTQKRDKLLRSKEQNKV